MISEALTAIKLQFDTYVATGSTSGIGKLRTGPLSKGATGDYCAYYMIDNGAEYTFTDAFENIMIQFLVCTKLGTNAITYASKIHSIFDNWHIDFYASGTTPPRTGGVVSMRRVRSPGLMADPEGGYTYPIRYEILVERA